MRIGIAFAGGGVRGAAHLGILQALEENNIQADCYAGTSAGSIVAAMKALGHSNATCLELMKQTNNRLIDIDYWGIIKNLPNKLSGLDSVLKGYELQKFLINSLGETSLRSVKKDLVVVSTNIDTGTQVVFSSLDFTKRDLRKIDDNIKAYDRYTPLSLPHIIYSSCAISGIFRPLSYGNMTLVDGSVTNILPSNLLKLAGVDKVIAVDLSQRNPDVGKVKGVFNILYQSASVMMDQNEYFSLTNTEDVIIMNPDVTSIPVLDFNKAQECYDIGYEYGKKMAAYVKVKLEQ